MKFIMKAKLVVSAWTEVEADGLEEALEIAKNRDVGTLSCNAIFPAQDESWHFEGDGLPQDVEVEEVAHETKVLC